MNDKEREAMEATLRRAREKRDNTIDKAASDFDKVLVDAYERGLSMTDLHLATGISVSTLRVRLKMAGAQVRSVGAPVRRKAL